MNYEDIFSQRGGDYDRAMRTFERARDEEFRLPLRLANVTPGEVVIDVPAGGGYLARHLPESCTWHGHEPCAALAGDGGLDQALLPLPWPNGFADLAMSIAGVHHLSDKRPLFRELRRVLKPDGRLMLADVHEASAVARFLDDFVGDNNSTGHDGSYLGEHTLQELRETGWQIVSAQRRAYSWRFDSSESLGRFCHQLFDLCKCGWQETAEAARERLGVTEDASGCQLHWELYFILAVPAGKAAKT